LDCGNVALGLYCCIVVSSGVSVMASVCWKSSQQSSDDLRQHSSCPHSAWTAQGSCHLSLLGEFTLVQAILLIAIVCHTRAPCLNHSTDLHATWQVQMLGK